MTFTATHIFAGHIPCIKGETANLNACTKVEFHPDYSLGQIQEAHSVYASAHPGEPFFKPVAQPQTKETVKWQNYSSWLL